MTTDTRRAPLGFLEAARAAFEFLADSGFSEVEAAPTLLRLRNHNFEVRIFHGRQSYEIGIDLCYDGERFSFSELLFACGADLESRYRNPVAQSSTEVRERLHELARIAKPCLLECVLDVDGCIERLRVVNKKKRQALADRTLAASVRPNADKAFREQDYETAARLYESIQGQLTPSEVERVRIAKRRTQL